MADADSLKFKIKADAGQAKRELRGLKSSTEKLSGVTQGLKTALLAAGAALLEATKEAIDYGDWLEKTAQKTGMSVEALSQYRLGAEMAGTSQESLVTGLQKLAKNMGTALRTPTGAAALAFKDLGVEVDDGTGKLRALEDILPELAEQFQNTTDITKKSAMAQELMGRSGAELIPFLNAGADGLEAMRKESDELNQTWSKESAAAAAEFNDEVSRLQAGLSGMFNMMVHSWIPTLADLVGGINLMLQAMLGASDATDGFSNSAVGYVNSVSKLIADTESRIDVLKHYLVTYDTWSEGKQKKKKKEMEEVQKQLKRAEGNLKTYERGLMQAREEYRSAKEAGLETIDLIATAAQREADLAELGVKSAEDLAKAVDKISLSFETADERRNRLLWTNLALVEQWGKDTGETEEAMRITLALMARMEEQSEASDRARRRRSSGRRKDKHKELKATLDGIAREVEAYRDSILTEEQLFDKQMDAREQAINDAVAAGIKTQQWGAARLHELWTWEKSEKLRFAQETADAEGEIEKVAAAERAEIRRREVEQIAEYSENTKQARIDVIMAIGSTASSIGSMITSLADEGNKEAAAAAKVMFGIQQSASLAVAIIKMAESIAVANASAPFPYNIPSLISATAIGTAQIAAITTATISGMAHAGMPPGALASAGMNEATILMRRDEMILDPVGTRAISEMLTQRAGDGQPVQVNTTLEIDGNVLGRTVDTHLVRSSERGLSYQNRIRY